MLKSSSSILAPLINKMISRAKINIIIKNNTTDILLDFDFTLFAMSDAANIIRTATTSRFAHPLLRRVPVQVRVHASPDPATGPAVPARRDQLAIYSAPGLGQTLNTSNINA